MKLLNEKQEKILFVFKDQFENKEKDTFVIVEHEKLCFGLCYFKNSNSVFGFTSISKVGENLIEKMKKESKDLFGETNFELALEIKKEKRGRNHKVLNKLNTAIQMRNVVFSAKQDTRDPNALRVLREIKEKKLQKPIEKANISIKCNFYL